MLGEAGDTGGADGLCEKSRAATQQPDRDNRTPLEVQITASCSSHSVGSGSRPFSTLRPSHKILFACGKSPTKIAAGERQGVGAGYMATPGAKRTDGLTRSEAVPTSSGKRLELVGPCEGDLRSASERILWTLAGHVRRNRVRPGGMDQSGTAIRFTPQSFTARSVGRCCGEAGPRCWPRWPWPRCLMPKPAAKNAGSGSGSRSIPATKSGCGGLYPGSTEPWGTGEFVTFTPFPALKQRDSN